MKKMFSVAAGVVLALSAYAINPGSLTTLAVSTPGPDTYQDGTPVLTGETYLLVYVKQGATFQGVYTDGALVDSANSTVVLKLSAVEGSKCGYTPIQYSTDQFPAGGTWVIVLLDTRTADGTVGGLVAGLGTGPAVASASAMSTGLNALNGAAGDGSQGISTVTAASAVPNVPAPEITSVQVNGAAVDVRFKNFSNKAIYAVQTATDLTGEWQTVATRVQATAQNVVKGATGDDELPATVTVQPTDTVRFFKVIVPNSAK